MINYNIPDSRCQEGFPLFLKTLSFQKYNRYPLINPRSLDKGLAVLTAGVNKSESDRFLNWQD